MNLNKIIIAGIGGVGGYFGGLLAKHYKADPFVQINFLARGEHLKQIKKSGLLVIKGDTSFIAKPNLTSNNALDFGIADYIFISTKTYDLESVAHSLSPCIDKHTILIPLLNGTNNREILKIIYPNNIVLDACVYIISRLKEAGVIENLGNIQTLYFGLDNYKNERFEMLESLLTNANIEAVYSKKIEQIIWEKFIFLSPIATATAAFDMEIGQLFEDEDSADFVLALINETYQIALSNNIALPDNAVAQAVHKLKALPYHTTSSMHADFLHKKVYNELDSLTNYVINEGKRLKIKTPNFQKALEKIKERYEV